MFEQKIVPSDTAPKGNKGENGSVLAAVQEFTDSILLRGREMPPLHLRTGKKRELDPDF